MHAGASTLDAPATRPLTLSPHPTLPPAGRFPSEIEAQSGSEREVVRSVSRHVQAGGVLEVELADVIASEQTHCETVTERDVHSAADVPCEVRCLRVDDRDRVDVVSNRTHARLDEW